MEESVKILIKLCQQSWRTTQWHWERSVSISKERRAFIYPLISHCSKTMYRSFNVDYSHTWKRRCLMPNFILEKAKKPKPQYTDACWITQNTEEVSMFFTDFKQAFDCVLSQLRNVLRNSQNLLLSS